jgi:hypothetical protein
MAERQAARVVAAPARRTRRARPFLYRWLRLVIPVTRPFSHASQARKRHRFYYQLLLSCLMVLLGFALPAAFRRTTTVSYNLMLLVLVFRLGAFSITPTVEHWMLKVYRLLGLATLISQLTWSLGPLAHRGTGLPLLLLWSIFAAWSTVRLVRLLATEVRINGRVLMGAVAGYLLIGITAGLLLAVLETVHPGSFRAVDAQNGAFILDGQLRGRADLSIWQVDFERLTYFAFVTITTVGFGDITPTTPQAQMMSVMFAVIGPIYIAVVMGVLISRITIQSTVQPTTRSTFQSTSQPAPQPAEQPAGQSAEQPAEQFISQSTARPLPSAGADRPPSSPSSTVVQAPPGDAAVGTHHPGEPEHHP